MGARCCSARTALGILPCGSSPDSIRRLGPSLPAHGRRARAHDNKGLNTVATIAEIFNLARQLHQAGQLWQAEPLYRQILDADPNHADAHHLLGVCFYQNGSMEDAVAAIRRALEIKPETTYYLL